MERLRNKLILVLTAVILIVGFATQLVITDLLLRELFYGYLAIPVFFMLLGLASIYFLTNDKNIDAKKRASRYMLHRTVKLLLAFAFIIIYWLINKAEIKPFAIVFVVFYLIYLFFETYLYMQIEKTLKKNENQN